MKRFLIFNLVLRNLSKLFFFLLIIIEFGETFISFGFLLGKLFRPGARQSETESVHRRYVMVIF